jgi:hypothetical protein
VETTIKITCKAATNIPLEELTPLQGDLKELSHRNFEKLKRPILRHGLSFPFFVWQHDGVNYVLDGHQRDRVLRKMQVGLGVKSLPLIKTMRNLLPQGIDRNRRLLDYLCWFVKASYGVPITQLGIA